MRRIGALVIVLSVCAAAVAAVGALALIRGTPSLSVPPVPTLARPIPDPGARKGSLRDAARALGGTILLPDTTHVSTSDIGAVWVKTSFHGDPTRTAVAVTFPSQRLFISYYEPPVPDAQIGLWAKDTPGVDLIWLDGVRADEYPQRPERPGWRGWGGITFVANGATVQVSGPADQSLLRAVAESMVDRATTTG